MDLHVESERVSDRPRIAGNSARWLTLAVCAASAATPLDAQQIGISTVYQEVNLCPNLTVAENIMIGRQPSRFHFSVWIMLGTAEERMAAASWLSGFSSGTGGRSVNFAFSSGSIIAEGMISR